MSAQWESQELLQPITAEQPCGENLEDTALLASFDAFRLFGQPTPLDPPPEWAVIRTRALEALEKSKDLRLLAHLGTALLRTDGLAAFSQTLQVASQWLETYWAGTYPLIDEDAILRRNALNCFADPIAVVDGLRRLPLVVSRQHGVFSLRDVDIVGGQMQPAEGETRPDEQRLEAAFLEMPIEPMQQLQQSVADGLAATKSIEKTMSAEGGPDAMPGFEGLAAQLTKIDRTPWQQRRGQGTADARGHQAQAVEAALAENPALGRYRDERGRNWLHLCCMARPANGSGPSVRTADLIAKIAKLK